MPSWASSLLRVLGDGIQTPGSRCDVTRYRRSPWQPGTARRPRVVISCHRPGSLRVTFTWRLPSQRPRPAAGEERWRAASAMASYKRLAKSFCNEASHWPGRGARSTTGDRVRASLFRKRYVALRSRPWPAGAPPTPSSLASWEGRFCPRSSILGEGRSNLRGKPMETPNGLAANAPLPFCRQPLSPTASLE